MKYLIGLLGGAGLMISGSALAKVAQSHGIELTQVKLVEVMLNRGPIIRKFYDHDNGVVCYTNSQHGISCLHN